MARLWIWSLGATLGSALYLGLHWYPGPPMPRAPRAVLEPRRMDLGEPAVAVSFKVNLSNLGGAILHIQSVSCQHKAVTLNVPSYDLGAGSSEELLGTFDPQGLHGPFQSAVLLHTDDPRHPDLNLLIEARVP